MIIVTTDHLEGYKIIEYMGLVCGESTGSYNYIEDIREAALKIMEDNAEAAGANAILSVGVSCGGYGSQYSYGVAIVASGTAAVVKAIEK